MIEICLRCTLILRRRNLLYCESLILWLKCLQQRANKRPGDSETAPPPKRSMYESTVQKIHEVDVIVGKLKTKHEGKYTPEQIRCWANMIQIKQHDSYESPPLINHFLRPKVIV